MGRIPAVVERKVAAGSSLELGACDKVWYQPRNKAGNKDWISKIEM